MHQSQLQNIVFLSLLYDIEGYKVQTDFAIKKNNFEIVKSFYLSMLNEERNSATFFASFSHVISSTSFKPLLTNFAALEDYLIIE